MKWTVHLTFYSKVILMGLSVYEKDINNSNGKKQSGRIQTGIDKHKQKQLPSRNRTVFEDISGRLQVLSPPPTSPPHYTAISLPHLQFFTITLPLFWNIDVIFLKRLIKKTHNQ